MGTIEQCRRLMGRLLMAVTIATFATPAAATYSTTCNGKGATPEVEVKAGQDIFEVRIGSGPSVSIFTSIRQRRAKGEALDFDILDRAGRISWRILLRPTAGGGFVGTMVSRSKKYWLRCGEMT